MQRVIDRKLLTFPAICDRTSPAMIKDKPTKPKGRSPGSRFTKQDSDIITIAGVASMLPSVSVQDIRDNLQSIPHFELAGKLLFSRTRIKDMIAGGGSLSVQEGRTGASAGTSPTSPGTSYSHLDQRFISRILEALQEAMRNENLSPTT